MIAPVSHVARMQAYALANLAAPKGKRLVSLCQNESLCPPSPKAILAAKTALETGQLYPDPDWADLRTALAARHGIDAESIVCGNGSLDLIGVLARVYLDPSRAALAPAHAYPFFGTATAMTGARFDVAPETDLTVDIDALLSAMRPETAVVFVANPGNPTGTRLPRSELIRLRDGLRDDVLLVLDEAYGEFADHLSEPMFDLVDRGNTIVLRTFSKAYGLAGLRVGWGLFPKAVAGEMRKLLNPNNIAAPSQAAAVAAVQDGGWMQDICAQTAEGRDRFAQELRATGLEVPHSFTNFVLMRFPSPRSATAADRALRAEGVFLRPQGGAGLSDCLRATVGVANDMDLAAGLLKDWIRKDGLG